MSIDGVLVGGLGDHVAEDRVADSVDVQVLVLEGGVEEGGVQFELLVLSHK